MDELRLAVGLRPGRAAAALPDRQDRGQERLAHGAGQREVVLPPRREIVVEHPAHAARAPPVRDVEVGLGPLGVAFVGVAPGGQRAAQRVVEMRGVVGIGDGGVEVGAAAEPPRPRRPEHARVHVDGRHVRVGHVRHEAHARGPEARIGVHPRHPAGGHGAARPLAQRAVDARDVDAHLLEGAALAHHAHQPAAAILAATGGRDLEAGGLALVGGGPAGRIGLERLERLDDPVAQGAEPRRRALLAVLELLGHRGPSPPRRLARIGRARKRALSARTCPPGRSACAPRPR